MERTFTQAHSRMGSQWSNPVEGCVLITNGQDMPVNNRAAYIGHVVSNGANSNLPAVGITNLTNLKLAPSQTIPWVAQHGSPPVAIAIVTSTADGKRDGLLGMYTLTIFNPTSLLLIVYFLRSCVMWSHCGSC
jgi:hypothetical protein